jgi:sorbose reductase
MPITLDFSGKLVLITGGGRGIGWAIVKALAAGESMPALIGLLIRCVAGADVAVSYTTRDPSAQVKELAVSHGVTILAFRCEVAKSEDVNALITDVEAAYGKKVDIGIACAGVTLWKDAHENGDGK